ncbi:hypothetical protein CEXT_393281 [Caerostris extrusa]|uniref:Uncharacterized protein n=1 Tax=Caerostris extrusa TaxID=172846 RepID=A0AAV4NBM4_CAEEX|nr:hypothetical protein CEXT_393281 [Caerostris extrusa]
MPLETIVFQLLRILQTTSCCLRNLGKVLFHHQVEDFASKWIKTLFSTLKVMLKVDKDPFHLQKYLPESG